MGERNAGIQVGHPAGVNRTHVPVRVEKVWRKGRVRNRPREHIAVSSEFKARV
jgi:hypothetical protein